MNQKIDSEKRLLERLSSSYFFVNPEQLFENHMLKVNQLEDHLIHRYKIFEQNHKKRLNDFVRKLCLIEEKKLNNKKNHLMINIEKLDALSPLKVLSRGYSLVYKNEDIVKTKKDLKENDEIIIKMQDGNIGAIVKQVK